MLPGLTQLAAAELDGIGAKVLGSREDALSFRYSGPGSDLARLRLSVAVYRVERFEVPRPKALLGHQHFTTLLGLVESIRGAEPAGFEGFRFGAAGSDSPVFRRIAQALEDATGLAHLPDDGELLLRFRPAGGGWEVLARLTPRPLSARGWRVCNIPGGLNATVAAAGLELIGRSAGERHLNLMCGSGTLLIERGLEGSWIRGVGVDVDPQALACARDNIAAAGLTERAELLQADATSLPFAEASFDRITVDLPWGDAIGGHEENSRLYPAFLAESARVAAPGARMLVITHELRLFERLLAAQDEWRQLGEPLRVFHGGHRPGLYLLERPQQR